MCPRSESPGTYTLVITSEPVLRPQAVPGEAGLVNQAHHDGCDGMLALIAGTVL